MGSVIGSREIRARKQHHCFLCSTPIEPGTVHLTWTWIEDGPHRLRVHVACNAYAQDCIPAWTDGDGCDPGAVDEHLYERLAVYTPREGVTAIDEKERADILSTWPALAPQVERACGRVRGQIAERAPEVPS